MTRKYFDGRIEELQPNEIFVFGSNLAGIHGAGAARTAMQCFGAVFGRGIGRTGKCYAIPTKDEDIQTMPTQKIGTFVDVFVEYARFNPDKLFYVTQIGCGLAGHSPRDIAPMFKRAPSNCVFDEEWRKYLD